MSGEGSCAILPYGAVMRVLRASIEIGGFAAILGLHTVIAILYALGSSLMADPTHHLVYWGAIALGYAAMALVVAGRHRTLGGIPWRSVLDAWLIAFPWRLRRSLSW